MKLTPEVLLRAYASGIFPMAEGRESAEVFWVEPRMRGIFPLDGFRISRSLRRTIRKGPFTPRVNTDFAGVVTGCADRPETWINPTIFELYLKLHASGHAHSLEVWEEDALVGGVYGVALGGAFFGESMFSRRTDASKFALAYLVDRLRQGGFQLFDTQFLTPHLASLGAVEITQSAYREMLAGALRIPADFMSPGALPSPHSLLQRSSQTS
ncbi:leucyl/phenylalanyl-tRNA--protein transferase [Tropicimonas isoalkanivorans]|uniref:Leucyl/phenylalanyl-tRNA--protein transferase n=1 Tax=Tropicimonas isoalkanivorans TaxID=441112 RepID=A0A1I1GGJ6_9RHOB|nr:leucyl/phenylalanyl-tRNA--protein transferase [Tropicimonas isoalkanivorans]SFC10565.1 leucyl/phenylalanyl-tRNA--protein transferase [Tropicimonas isoalkanivorans]